MKFSRTRAAFIGAASAATLLTGSSLRAEGVAKEEPPMWANVGDELTCSSSGFMGAQRRDGKIVTYYFTGTQSSLDAMDNEERGLLETCRDMVMTVGDWDNAHNTFAEAKDLIPWTPEKEKQNANARELTIEISLEPLDKDLRFALQLRHSKLANVTPRP